MNDWRDKSKIKEVREVRDGWEITTEDSLCCLLESTYGVTPKIGDTIEFRGPGMSIYGMRINGEVVYNHSDEEMDRRHKEWCENRDKQRKEDFEKNKDKMDQQFSALPIEFQRKIARHRRYNSDFRWKLEPYELFVCSEAVKFIDYFKKFDKDEIQKEINRFAKLSYKDQLKEIPTIEDGHSGNTFGKALSFASMYLKDPRYIPIMHGALAEIGGCEEYGCPPPTKEEWLGAGFLEHEICL